MEKLKIVLGDLRHNTIGRHSVFMPIAIGYIASYLLSKLGPEYVDVRLYDDPKEIFDCIDDWNPDVIGLSNYCWNTNLSKMVFEYAKKKNPNIVSVSGGPEFPTDNKECRDYLLKRSKIDFFVYREGEVAFLKLVQKIKNKICVNDLKSNPQAGIMSIHPKTKRLVIGEVISRIEDLDEIPSPYLTGLMDKWFNSHYAPSIEMARGCPFTCAYCKASFLWFSHMARFSIRRIKDELTYMAKKMKSYPDVLLSICDSNFGMTEEDEKIAIHLRHLQDQFNWPNAFNVTTGKANYDRILRISSILKNKMLISTSVQTLNSKTLKIINRRNLPLDQYKELQKKIKKLGMSALAEIIIPMPEETKKSYFDSIKILLDSEIDFIETYTLMLLKGAPLASKKLRKKYEMKTGFRLLPRQFGEYKKKKCFEIEEVCIENNTMSFKDYLDCRGFALTSLLLSSEQFNFIQKHLKDFNIDVYDYMTKIWDAIKLEKNKVSSIYQTYIEETKKELFDSEKEIYQYFSKQKNYDKLLKGELGDNLLRKYRTKMLLECCVPLIKLMYCVLKDSIKSKSGSEINESLKAAEQWMIITRNISEVIKNKSFRKKTKMISSNYDVNAWLSSDGSNPLTFYKRHVSYEVCCDKDHIEEILDELKKLYGKDLIFCIGKFFINNSVKEFWRKSNVKLGN
ncbi:MAG: cobalamin-dependent protein [Candidatus Firestonebacteria bacterium]